MTNANSDFRVVAQVTPANLGGSTTVWVVLVSDDAIGGTARGASREIGTNFSETLAVALPGGTGNAVTVTEEDLNKAITIAVESRQGVVSADNEWKRSGTAPVAAKPDDS